MQRVYKPTFNKDLCTTWVINKGVNPKTNRKIKIGGPTYKKYLRDCKYFNIHTYVFDKLPQHIEDIIMDMKHQMEELEKPGCPICLEHLNNKTMKTNCGHCFHTDCINNWKKQSFIRTGKRTCPLCRSDITTEKERRIIEQKRQRRESILRERRRRYRENQLNYRINSVLNNIDLSIENHFNRCIRVERSGSNVVYHINL